MAPLFGENFLLKSQLAENIYRQVTHLPIVDYHSHLPVEVIAKNKSFENLTELWIQGDHYKWRAMRLNGVPESLCSGSGQEFQRFKAWAETLPLTLRNPIYHWSHLELRQYFGIHGELNSESALSVWHEVNEQLKTPDFTPKAILKRSGVQILCTTDDPADSLEHHAALREDDRFDVSVFPTFRPDSACALNGISMFQGWLDRLRKITNLSIANLSGLLDALKLRHEAFHLQGCRISDHGLECLANAECNEQEASNLFAQLLKGSTLNPEDLAKWQVFLMRQFAEWNHEKGWTMMLHLGAMRNNNSRVFSKLGLDSGCDSVGDYSQARGLNSFLNSLDHAQRLPKVILFNSNPRDNLLFATIAGNFFEDGVPGKVQYGPAWWFLDTASGITSQFDAMSSVGLAHRFVGMVTDSRCFLSFSRHDYFRRLICNLYAKDAIEGSLPLDEGRLAKSLTAICHQNALNYFGWDTAPC